MCQAPVGKVIDVGRGTITVEHKGKARTLRSKLDGVVRGDYVLFSVDIAIEKIDREEAEAIMVDMK